MQRRRILPNAFHATVPPCSLTSSICGISTPSRSGSWRGGSSARASATHWQEVRGDADRRHRLHHALSRHFPRGGGALSRLHAGLAGRGEMAVEPAGARGARRRDRIAADRRRGRPRAARACARNGGRSGYAAARSVARPVGERAAARGRAEPARACGRAWTRRRSVTAGPIRARRSPASCARPCSRRRAGARRCSCRRCSATGFCARPASGSARARPSSRRFPACISWKRASRPIARFRCGARSACWCRRLKPALAPSPGGAARVSCASFRGAGQAAFPRLSEATGTTKRGLSSIPVRGIARPGMTIPRPAAGPAAGRRRLRRRHIGPRAAMCCAGGAGAAGSDRPALLPGRHSAAARPAPACR